jgi:hypothetical protein
MSKLSSNIPKHRRVLVKIIRMEAPKLLFTGILMRSAKHFQGIVWEVGSKKEVGRATNSLKVSVVLSAITEILTC